MNNYTAIYNANTKQAQIRPADLKRVNGTFDSKTGKVATGINSFLKLRTGDESNETLGVTYGHHNYRKFIQLAAVPIVSEAGGDETLRVTAIVFDKDAPDEPKCFELINYNLSIAHPKDVVAGLALSLAEGPLAEMTYTKLKISIMRDFLDALQQCITQIPITK